MIHSFCTFENGQIIYFLHVQIFLEPEILQKKIRGYALIGAAGSSVAVLLSSFPELLSSVELQPKSARDITISRVPSKRVVFSL